jgi:RNA polymerase sigma-70 factor (ECF subfamily)
MPILKRKYGKLSDEKLMERIQHQDTSAFNELYERYSQRLLLYFYRTLGGNQDKAQDFLQDIFLKLIQKPELFDPERRFSSWIFTVAYNLCKNEYRRLETRNAVENNPEINPISRGLQNPNPHPEHDVDQKDFKNALFHELNKLDENHRSTFLLRHQQNLCIEEISEILGCPEGTVKSRLYYTTKRLAARLKAFNPYSTQVKKK